MWVNTALTNLKAAITSIYRAVSSKRVPRHPAKFEYGSNQRCELAAMIPRFCSAGVRTTPMPDHLLRMAKVYG